MIGRAVSVRNMFAGMSGLSLMGSGAVTGLSGPGPGGIEAGLSNGLAVGGTATVRRRVPAYRQLLLERLDAGTFLGQQFLLVLAGRQLLLERLDAGTFLRQQFLIVIAARHFYLSV